MLLRRLSLKFKRQSSLYLKYLIIFFICAFLFDKLIIEKRIFRRGKINVQKDLLNYNEDGLRGDWSFEITKHYDVYDLQSYISKPRSVPTSDLPGEGGIGVKLSSVFDDIVELSFNEYQINTVASDKIAFNRSIPDYRQPNCLDIKYPSRLPTASIVMAVHNEAWSILLRSIWSVINRSPDQLLEEIILIDDFSDKAHLKEPLEGYLSKNFPYNVKLVRTEQREGLTRARLIGAEKAQGQVIVFLDANVEVGERWLEPLLSRIASDRSVITVPYVDYINSNMSFEKLNESIIYGIGWNLYHYSYPLPEREILRNRGDETAPYRTPTLMGMAIAVDREFFFEIGSFDAGMNIWGGENVELSLRAWQCGGAVEIVPCSRIGHHFRQLPYSFNADNEEEVKLHNNIRAAEIWMDEYISYFQIVIPPHLKKVKGGDVSERLALRQKLKCKGFRWFLENIFPESVMVGGVNKIGQLQRVGSKFCMDRLGRERNKQIGIYQCHGHGYSQGFSYQKNQQIVFHHSECLSLAKEEKNNCAPIEEAPNVSDSIVVDPILKKPIVGADSNVLNLLTPEVTTTPAPVNTTNHVVLLPCNATNGEKWSYNESKNQIIHVNTGMCLATDLWMVAVAPCDLKDERQKWVIIKFEDYKRKLMNDANAVNRGNQ